MRAAQRVYAAFISCAPSGLATPFPGDLNKTLQCVRLSPADTFVCIRHKLGLLPVCNLNSECKLTQ